jgi:hypothetical protein
VGIYRGSGSSTWIELSSLSSAAVVANVAGRPADLSGPPVAIATSGPDKSRGLALAWVGLTCVVAAVGYSGAVTTHALAGFVLPGVVGCALVAAVAATRRGWLGCAAAGFGAALAWSSVVNVMSGLDNGPAARSTFVAGCCAGLAIGLASSRWPALFAAPVAGTLVGALALGAGTKVRLVAVVTVVFAVIALSAIESARRNAVGRPRRRLAVPVVAVLVTLVAAAVVVLQAQHDPRHPAILNRGAVDFRVHSSIPDPFPVTKPHHQKTAAAAVASPRRTTVRRTPPKVLAHHRSRALALLGWALLGLLVLLALGLAAVAARLLVVRLRWRRLRRRLGRGSAEERVMGAWTWLRLRLGACRVPVGPHVSPESVMDVPGVSELPHGTPERLGNLGRMAAAVAFCGDRGASVAEAETAWMLALTAAVDTEASLPRLQRLRVRFVAPAGR